MWCGMNKIIEIKFGSHLYGTETENSDLDFKAIYLPTAREICLNSYKRTISTTRSKQTFERNTKNDVDVEILSLDRFLELLAEGQTMALDMLFSPEFKFTPYKSDMSGLILGQIYENRGALLTRNVNAFIGYARQQASRYGIKGSRMDILKRLLELLNTLPLRDRLSAHKEKFDELISLSTEFVSLEGKPLLQWLDVPAPDKVTMIPHLEVCGRKFSITQNVQLTISICQKIFDGYGQRAYKAHLSGGKDYKALSHAVRVNSEALELLETGYITFPRPDRELLRDIKQEKIPYDDIAEIIENGLVKLEEAYKVSSLRDKPDREWIDNFVYEIYSEIVKNEL